MTLCLVLGGAECVWSDLAAALDLCRPDHVVACNDVASGYAGELDAFVTLHPDKLPGWLERRRGLGLPHPKRIVAHQRKTMIDGQGYGLVTDLIDFKWPGHVGISGSSGLFSVKVAFELIGADQVLLCGVPMDDRAHFFDTQRWTAVRNFRATWEALAPELSGRVRSMSGWTRDQFGGPDADWLRA